MDSDAGRSAFQPFHQRCRQHSNPAVVEGIGQRDRDVLVRVRDEAGRRLHQGDLVAGSAAQLARDKVTQQRPGCGSSTARTVGGSPSTWSVRAWSMAWLAPQTS